MKSITIHNLDDSLDTLIRERAKKQGTSLNKTIQQLLKQALGLKPGKKPDHRDDFSELSGIWSKKDLNDFTSKTKDFGKIDESDWR